MKKISNMIEDYKDFHSSLTPEVKEHLSRLPEGQSPEVLMITCSDSRIEPAMVLGSAPGDVFTIRNAGNIVTAESKADLGTIQFAVDILKVKHIVICGHTDCGAVKGILALDSLKEKRYLSDWLSACQCKVDLDPECEMDANLKNHVLNQVYNLSQLDFIKDKLASSELEIHGWLIDLGDYKIQEFDSTNSAWQDLGSKVNSCSEADMAGSAA